MKTNGTLACWGNNQNGQATAPDSIYTQVSAGVSHTCAVGSDGTIACWGSNDGGQAPRVTISPADLPDVARGGCAADLERHWRVGWAIYLYHRQWHAAARPEP